MFRSALLALSLALSAAPKLSRELEAVTKKLAATESVSARFKQTRTLSALNDALLTEGTFSYSKGGKLVWKTNPPNESELSLEGKSASIRYPALGTTQTFDFAGEPGMAAVFDSIRAVLQADLERLRPHYDLVENGKSPLQLTLTPKSPEVAKVLQTIRLAFDAQQNLSRVVLEEPGGDRTEVLFEGHQVSLAGKGK